uniref:Uncharacterized protein n=1 Tax=Arundo donax TaxID=35708 RepID=A0A0A9DL38_ARUDO
MVYIAGHVSLVCSINDHIAADLTKVEVSITQPSHFPESFLTCFVINNFSYIFYNKFSFLYFVLSYQSKATFLCLK